jgi:hypothetical protein
MNKERELWLKENLALLLKRVLTFDNPDDRYRVLVGSFLGLAQFTREQTEVFIALMERGKLSDLLTTTSSSMSN